MKVRRIFGGFAAAAVAVTVAACSGSTTPTSSPAGTVPSSAVLYASVTVQPSGSELQTLQNLANAVGGPGTASKLMTKLDQALAKTHNGISFNKDVAPWLGQKVAMVITQLPKNPSAGSNAMAPYMAFILPTAHPAAAQKALATMLKASPKGLPKGMTAEVHGDYVLVGGTQAVSALASTTSGDSLAYNTNYQADVAKLEPDTLATVYVNSHSFFNFFEAAMKSAPNGAGALLKSLPTVPTDATAMFGLALTSNSARLDIVSTGSTGTPPATPADVSGMPGDSWLAVSTASMSAAQLKQLSSLMSTMGSIQSSSAHGGGMTLKSPYSSKASFSPAASGASTLFVSSSKSSAAPSFPSGAVGSLVPMLFKNGLGPIHFSVAGTSVKGLRAGLSLSEKDATAAKQLTQLIYTFASMGGKAKVSGSPSSFSVALNKHWTAKVGTNGSDAVATIGYPNVAAFDSPSSKLADNSVYQSAVAQLPSGSHVAVFANVAGISTLVDSNATAAKQPFATVLKRFSYVVMGGTQGHERIVVGLK